MLRHLAVNTFIAGAATAAMALGAGTGIATAATPHGHHRGGPTDRSARSPSGGGRSHTDALNTIRFRVWDATETPLDYYKSGVEHGDWRSRPGSLDLLHNADFTLDSNIIGQAEDTTTWLIGQTGYKVELYGQKSALGAEAHCSILDSADKVTTTSPYQCRTERSDASDMDVWAVVEPKQAQTHRLENFETYNPKNMATAWCTREYGGGDDKYARCDLTKDDVSTDYASFRVASDTLINCSTATASHQITASTTTGTTNTIGLKGELNGKLFQAINWKLEANYSRAWTNSRTTSRSVTLNVPAGSYGWIDLAQKVQTVRGSFRIHIGNQTYDINDFAVSAPLSADGDESKFSTYRVKSEQIPQDSRVCTGHGGGEFFKDSPLDVADGATFTIGIKGSNQRVVTVPGAVGTETQLELAQNENKANQQWIFVKDGDDFQIRSEAHPKMCLWADHNSWQVTQHACGSQRNDEYWDVAYDPDQGGYRLIGFQGPGLATAGGGKELGTKLVGSFGTDQNWVFKEVD
jgi:hypothetical protein